MSDPSQPLKNTRHERYCVERAKGIPQWEAWSRTLPFGKQHSGSNRSLRAHACTVERRPEVKARLEHLRKQALVETDADALPETLSRDDVIALSLEVGTILEAAYRAASSGEIVVSPQKIEALKTVWQGHLGRQAKFGETDAPLAKKADFDVAALHDRITRRCECREPH